MASQLITPELRNWIMEQAAAGAQPDAVLQAMKASGWQEEVALKALQDVLLHEMAHDDEGTRRVPDVLSQGRCRVWAHDREVTIQVEMQHPRVVVFQNLLSIEECEGLIALSKPRLARSETVVNTTGASEVNAARTSQGMFFGRGENELCTRIEARIAALVSWPVERGEGLQILRYAPGAEYRPHYDYFDPAHGGTATILQRGGQRVGTLVMYLNTPEKGGATVFPDAGLTVHAVAGAAVFFSYAWPMPATKTLHGGAVVEEGEKWVATKWMREGTFS